MRFCMIVWLLFFISCVSERELNPLLEERSILGPWKFSEYLFSPGGPQIHRSLVAEDKAIIFRKNGALLSHGFFRCDQGRYTLEGNALTIDFDCSEEPEKRVFILSWEGDNLYMEPSFPRCIEYCAYVFVNEL